MAMDFRYVLARVTAWGAHESEQPLVKRLAAERINNSAEIEVVGKEALTWLREGKNLARDRFSVGSTNSDDRYSSFSRRGGDRSDGIVFVHGPVKVFRTGEDSFVICSPLLSPCCFWPSFIRTPAGVLQHARALAVALARAR